MSITPKKASIQISPRDQTIASPNITSPRQQSVVNYQLKEGTEPSNPIQKQLLFNINYLS